VLQPYVKESVDWNGSSSTRIQPHNKGTMPLKVYHNKEFLLETVPMPQIYGRTVLPYTFLYTNH